MIRLITKILPCELRVHGFNAILAATLSCAVLPDLVSAADSLKSGVGNLAAEKVPSQPGTLPSEMRDWKVPTQSGATPLRARMVDVEIRDAGTFVTLEDEQGVKQTHSARDLFEKGNSYLDPFLKNARQNKGKVLASFRSTLNGEMRVWTQMTVPFETKFRAQLMDVEYRGTRPYVALRTENGEVKWYSGYEFFRRDDEYLKPFLANARRVDDPAEAAKKAAALAAENAAIEKRGYPKIADPQWSAEKLAAYEAILAADASLAAVCAQINEIEQSQMLRRRLMRDAQERNPGIYGRDLQMPSVGAPPHLLARRTALSQRKEDAVQAFRGSPN